VNNTENKNQRKTKMNPLEKQLTLKAQEATRLLLEVIRTNRTDELKNNPKAVIEDVLGYRVPEGMEVNVVTESADQGYIVIPQLPKDPSSLKDDDLKGLLGVLSTTSHDGSCK
jgi:hypothetical protein